MSEQQINQEADRWAEMYHVPGVNFLDPIRNMIRVHKIGWAKWNDDQKATWVNYTVSGLQPYRRPGNDCGPTRSSWEAAQDMERRR